MTSFSAQTSVVDGPAYPEPQSPAESHAPPGWDLGPEPQLWGYLEKSCCVPPASQGHWEVKLLQNESPGHEEGSGGLQALTTPLPSPHLCCQRSQLPAALPRAPVPLPAHSSAHCPSVSTCSGLIRADQVLSLCSELLEPSQPEKAGQTAPVGLGSHMQTKENFLGVQRSVPCRTQSRHVAHV